MIALIQRPAVTPASPRTIRLTDKQTIAANLRMEAFVHETHPYTADRALREIRVQLTIVKSSPDIGRHPEIEAFRRGK